MSAVCKWLPTKPRSCLLACHRTSASIDRSSSPLRRLHCPYGGSGSPEGRAAGPGSGVQMSPRRLTSHPWTLMKRETWVSGPPCVAGWHTSVPAPLAVPCTPPPHHSRAHEQRVSELRSACPPRCCRHPPEAAVARRCRHRGCGGGLRSGSRGRGGLRLCRHHLG